MGNWTASYGYRTRPRVSSTASDSVTTSHILFEPYTGYQSGCESALRYARTCSKPQIGRIIGQKADILKDWEAGCRADLKIKRRTTQYEELNCLVWDWFCTARSKELPVSGKLIQVCFCRLLSYFLTSLFF